MAHVSKCSTLAELVDVATQEFVRLYKHSSNLHVCCAPGRVNLIGEHTDYNDGFVFPMALPLVTVIVGEKVEGTTCTVTTLAETVGDQRTVSFENPSNGTPAGQDTPSTNGSTLPSWASYVKGVASCYTGGCYPSFRAVIHSSVPLGGGLSSSAALEVATHTFLETLTPTFMKIPDKEKALTCQKAEHEYAGVPCGIMDQFVSVMGKAGHALLLDCRSMKPTLVPLNDPDLVILICDSNVHHELGASEYPVRRAHCEQGAKILGKQSLRDATMEELIAHKATMESVIFRRCHHAISESLRCEQAYEALCKNDYSLFGQLMIQSHNSLRDDYDVSCAELDSLVSSACECDGVYGSRMTGGGFGGCTVSLVSKDAVQNVMDHIKGRYAGDVTFYICQPSDGARALDVNNLS